MTDAADVLGRERDLIARKIDALADELRGLRAQLRELDEAIYHLTGNSTSSPTASSLPKRNGANGKSRLIDRIEEMLPVVGDGTSPSELAATLKEQGRETSGETVASLLSRLKKEGKAVKRGRAWFRPPTLEATATEHAVSDPSEPQDGQMETGSDVAAPLPAMSHT